MIDATTPIVICVMHNEQKRAEGDTRADGAQADRVRGAASDEPGLDQPYGVGGNDHYAADGVIDRACRQGARR